ncbi:hypothetical protein L1987_79229 [Smallanthus sonchifolius]|uniref:Uncharacterized protein n=1 Tax=Smallanthus sonchifolius TaxID=185202 RepID=A0ACB8ZF48_9ASTR|nr:hypothetical protein L1987_79229 [Smallanthus sonchifolius]
MGDPKISGRKSKSDGNPKLSQIMYKSMVDSHRKYPYDALHMMIGDSWIVFLAYDERQLALREVTFWELLHVLQNLG